MNNFENLSKLIEAHVDFQQLFDKQVTAEQIEKFREQRIKIGNNDPVLWVNKKIKIFGNTLPPSADVVIIAFSHKAGNAVPFIKFDLPQCQFPAEIKLSELPGSPDLEQTGWHAQHYTSGFIIAVKGINAFMVEIDRIGL